MEHWVIGCWVWMGVLIGWCLYRKEIKDREERRKKRGEIPKGNTGWPLIGETLEFIACGYTSRPVTFMEKRKASYGKVFRTHILGSPVMVSTDAEVNRAVLQNQGNAFAPCYPKSVRELMGKSSILQINGSLHRRLHSLTGSFLKSPLFKASVTRRIETSVKLSLATWLHHPHVYVQDHIKEITFEVLVRVLMSVGAGEDLEFFKREFGEFIKGLICVPIKFPGTRLYKSLKAKERLLKRVRRIVEERKMGMERRDKNGIPQPPPTDVVDALLRDAGDPNSSSDVPKQHLPLDLITGNIIEMMIPGEETLPTAITLALKYLTDCPLALHNLTEENMELKKRKAHVDCSWNDYMSLPFTQNVISETLRIANVINAVWRKALKDVEIKGYLIPQGWCVLASLSSVHMDEEIYENPYQFDPWRWEKKGAAATTIYNGFTPFGGGQRLCPGLELSRLEISIFLHHLVTTYRWVAEDDDITYFPTVKMKRRLPITVTPLAS